MKILFLGSSRFSKIVLEKMLENNENVVAVITQVDKPSGRGHKLTPTEVNVFAKEKGIKVFTFDKVKNHIDEIKQIDYDLAVVASFGQILTEEFLNIALTINVHPSLLPKYRGATPIQSALLNCDEVTGVTIMKVAKEVDSGDILLQRSYALARESYLELEDVLAKIGGDMVSEAIELIENGTCEWKKQDDERAVMVKKMSKEDGVLDFSQPKEKILGKVRALSEEVGCFVYLNGLPLKVGSAKECCDEVLEEKEISTNKKSFVIGCKNGSIELTKVQAPSGKMISGRDYINGHNEILGKRID